MLTRIFRWSTTAFDIKCSSLSLSLLLLLLLSPIKILISSKRCEFLLSRVRRCTTFVPTKSWRKMKIGATRAQWIQRPRVQIPSTYNIHVFQFVYLT